MRSSRAGMALQAWAAATRRRGRLFLVALGTEEARLCRALRIPRYSGVHRQLVLQSSTPCRLLIWLTYLDANPTCPRGNPLAPASSRPDLPPRCLSSRALAAHWTT